MTHHRLHIEEVALPSLTFQSKPHCGQCVIWLGGDLAKEVVFFHSCLFCYFEQTHFVIFSGLLSILFVEAVCFFFFFFFCKAKNIVT